MPYSLISRRTTGDRTRPSVADGASAAAGSGTGAGAGAGAGAGSSGSVGGGGGGAALVASGGGAAASGSGAAGEAGGSGASGAASGAESAGGAAAGAAPSDTTASTVPTSTVSPSGTSISVIVPDAVDGTSESTLSVETSNRTSSWLTVSPTDLNHRVMVPSVTVSPSWGISIWATGRQLLTVCVVVGIVAVGGCPLTTLGRRAIVKRTLDASPRTNPGSRHGVNSVNEASARSGPVPTRRTARSWSGGVG